MNWNDLKKLADAKVTATLSDLPGDLRRRAMAVPVTFEHTPHAAFIAEGIEPDTLGLFTGPAFGEELEAAAPLPPQIILYLENLWDFAEADKEVFVAEVRTTYLHELGHYLGLDENDLTERGLD